MSCDRRDFLKRSAGCGMLMAMGSSRVLARSVGGDRKPNILIIYTDDQGIGDVGCYDREIPTPNLDALAAGGMKFTNFYAPQSVCTPSRYGLLTGCYPARSQGGLDDVAMPGDSSHLTAQEKTIAEKLQKDGYHTGLIGKWHLGSAEPSHYPQNHGFDLFTGFMGGCIDYYRHEYGSRHKDWYVNGQKKQEQGYATDLMTDHALAYFNQRKEDTRPFFLYLSYNAPHYAKTDPDNIPDNTLVVKQMGRQKNTLQAPAEYLEKFKHIEDEKRRYYAAMVSNLDDNVGRVVKRLKDNGQYENTMIWFVSDNGADEDYGGDNGIYSGEKATLHEGGIRMPAFVSWPGHIPAGRVVDQLAGTVDLAPTLAAISGEGAIGGLPVDGVDLSSVLFDGDSFSRNLFWISGSGNDHAFRREQWKLRGGKLFDLKNDPKEQTDLSSSKTSVYNDIKQRYEPTKTALEGGNPTDPQIYRDQVKKKPGRAAPRRRR